MSFPPVENIRQTLESSIHRGLAAQSGEWFATLDNGREVSFDCRESGVVELRYCLDDDELENLPENTEPEKLYRYRIRIEALPYQGE